MALYEVPFDSFNKRDTVHAWIYTPTFAPSAIVQLVHGLGEHSRRYIQLISTLLEAGFVVVADDHVGHGKTGMESEIWQDTGDTGWCTYIEDEHTLTQIAKEQFPDLPFFLFGHSWGSMIARAYAAKYANELDGLILCGLVEQMEGMELVDIDALESIMNDNGGISPARELAAPLFTNAIERFPEGSSPGAWIASDPEIVEDHGRDPFNNFSAEMTVRFLKDFVDLYRHVTDPELVISFPTNLPVLILAGDQDPVGNYGEGVYHAANKMWKHGMRDIRTVLYSGLRHEVHNEPESRQDVEMEIISFVLTHTYEIKNSQDD